MFHQRWVGQAAGIAGGAPRAAAAAQLARPVPRASPAPRPQLAIGMAVLLATISAPAVWNALTLQGALLSPIYAMVTLCVCLQPLLGAHGPTAFAPSPAAACCCRLLLPPPPPLPLQALASTASQGAACTAGLGTPLPSCPAHQPPLSPPPSAPCRCRLAVRADARGGGGGGRRPGLGLHVRGGAVRRPGSPAAAAAAAAAATTAPRPHPLGGSVSAAVR